MQIVKKSGALRVYAGDGMVCGLFIGENIKTGKMSLWCDTKKIKLCECIY